MLVFPIVVGEVPIAVVFALTSVFVFGVGVLKLTEATTSTVNVFADFKSMDAVVPAVVILLFVVE
jgi:hypothetical protein